MRSLILFAFIGALTAQVFSQREGDVDKTGPPKDGAITRRPKVDDKTKVPGSGGITKPDADGRTRQPGDGIVTRRPEVGDKTKGAGNGRVTRRPKDDNKKRKGKPKKYIKKIKGGKGFGKMKKMKQKFSKKMKSFMKMKKGMFRKRKQN